MGKSPSHKKTHVTIPRWAQQQDRFGRGRHYPNCKGSFPDCPEQIVPDVLLEQCKSCPFYK